MSSVNTHLFNFDVAMLKVPVLLMTAEFQLVFEICLVSDC